MVVLVLVLAVVPRSRRSGAGTISAAVPGTGMVGLAAEAAGPEAAGLEAKEGGLRASEMSIVKPHTAGHHTTPALAHGGSFPHLWTPDCIRTHPTIAFTFS